MTDPELLIDYDPETSILCKKAISQLPKLSLFDHILVNSKYTNKSLSPFISMEPTVIPPIFGDMPIFSRPVINSNQVRKETTLLVVGRVVPHKKIEDAISLLSDIRNLGYDYTMAVVGPTPNLTYSKYLFNYARDHGVLDSLIFTGRVTNEDLFNLYQNSKSFLSMSQHEGFCVPVVEAMHFGLPIFVHEGTAAQETAGNAGILLGNCGDLNNLITITSILDSPSQVSIQSQKGTERKKIILESISDYAWNNLFALL